MCNDCEYDKALESIEARLCQSPYAPHVAELLQISEGVTQRKHLGDALFYRLKDLDEKVQDRLDGPDL